MLSRQTGSPISPAIGKSRGKVLRGGRSCPAPERFGSRAEPLANRATTARRHLCSQGAGPPPGVLRGRTTPTAEASRGSLSVPRPRPRRNAGGGAVNPHPASAGSAGPAGGRGEHAAVPRGLSGRPAAGARLTLRCPRVNRAWPGWRAPESHAAATPTARAVQGEPRVGLRSPGRGAARGRPGAGGGREGDAAAGAQRRQGEAGVRRGAAGAELASERLRPRM